MIEKKDTVTYYCLQQKRFERLYKVRNTLYKVESYLILNEQGQIEIGFLYHVGKLLEFCSKELEKISSSIFNTNKKRRFILKKYNVVISTIKSLTEELGLPDKKIQRLDINDIVSDFIYIEFYENNYRNILR